MMQSVTNTDRVAPPWAPPSRGFERLCQAATAVLDGVLGLCGLRSGTPQLWMGRRWLEEHEREARKH